MRKKLTHNFGLKMISLVLAIMLWLVVLSIEDPVYTREFTDIPVTEINGDKITEAGKAYSYVDGEKVSVKVKGKTSIVNKLSKDDFLAVADLSTLSITGAVMVDVSCPNYPSLEITPVGSSTVLRIEIEDLKEKSLNVRVVTNGKSASGYYVGQGVATPNLVTVSGPASAVDKIEEAVVYVQVNSYHTKDITTNAALVLLDKNGDSVSSSTISLSQSTISVVVPIYETKTVPLFMNIVGEPADDYQVVSFAYEPKEVTVAGRSENLKQIESITLDDYDVSGANTKIESTVHLQEALSGKLPDGVILTDKDASIAVVVDVQQLIDETFEYPLSKVSLIGQNSALKYTITSDSDETKTTSIKVRGIESQVKELTADQMTVFANVTGLDQGEYTIPLAVTFDNDVTLNEKVNVHITIE